jgi:hypothetical protein
VLTGNTSQLVSEVVGFRSIMNLGAQSVVISPFYEDGQDEADPMKITSQENRSWT